MSDREQLVQALQVHFAIMMWHLHKAETEPGTIDEHLKEVRERMKKSNMLLALDAQERGGVNSGISKKAAAKGAGI